MAELGSVEHTGMRCCSRTSNLRVVMPEAVSIDREGFKMVDYAMLGIIMPNSSLLDESALSNG